MSLTPEQVEFFEEHGYLTGLDVHDADATARVARDFDDLESREGKDHCQVGLHGRHIDQQFIWRLAIEPIILDAIEALMGSDIMVLSTHFFCKYPSTSQSAERYVAWHQDITYWGLDPPYALTAWYAVDDSDIENGCMRVLPATHRSGVVEHGTSSEPGNLLSINQEILDVDDSTAVDLVLRAGQMSIHHGHLVHGSNSNRSNRRRCGLTIRYCPPSVKPVRENSLGVPWPARLARGEDQYQHFDDFPLQF
ncbi:MAG: phytanoyl-CoA dioxygenase family protein [Pirellulaceae bacterium]|jgi:ectoine hydroxylase-related dioxygenase (phytanoyl-CoA dioxygenase family)|nr:phytanoyl-CoA dioxygenase family protein [Pirellulaceae bacterium]MDP7014856.1 phytanoyl-CoA dioxygenase family protein [Pirellulaceae bacterium]